VVTEVLVIGVITEVGVIGVVTEVGVIGVVAKVGVRGGHQGYQGKNVFQMCGSPISKVQRDSGSADISPSLPPSLPPSFYRLTLDEIAAAAELILAQDSEDKEIVSGSESSDEGLGGEVESDMEEEQEEEAEVDLGKASEEFLGDSGYGANASPVAMETE
jgi:hypothetical protein